MRVQYQGRIPAPAARTMSHDPRHPRRIIAMLALVVLCACATAPPGDDADDPATAQDSAVRQLRNAQEWARHAGQQDSRWAHEAHLQCAVWAHRALGEERTSPAAAVLATRCTDALLVAMLGERPRGWTPGPVTVAGVRVDVEFRQLSPVLSGALSLTRAQDVPMHLYEGERMAHGGFGVPLAAIAPRCTDRAICEFLPPEGVFRDVTAWIEPPVDPNAPPRLVIGNPLALQAINVGTQRIPLSYD